MVGEKIQTEKYIHTWGKKDTNPDEQKKKSYYHYYLSFLKFFNNIYNLSLSFIISI